MKKGSIMGQNVAANLLLRAASADEEAVSILVQPFTWVDLPTAVPWDNPTLALNLTYIHIRVYVHREDIHSYA